MREAFIMDSGNGGRQRAVFAGYDLSGLDLSHRNLNQAVFTGSRMTETSLEEQRCVLRNSQMCR